MANPTSKLNLAQRLATVEAKLRSDLEVSRHMFRGTPSYVVRNPITFQSHNFSASDYQILVALDSDQALGEIFDELVEAGRLTADQEDGFYSFILNLHQLGFLNLPVSDSKSLYTRFKRRQGHQRQARFTGFLFLRVPLLNPDAMLDRTVRYVAPLFSRYAFTLWLVLMLCCIGILWQRWDDFKEPLQTILVTKNLAGLWILLVLLKVIHEFGHAYVCKLFGGKVPEMGAYFICFTPCAYVDASAAWGFTGKRQRIAVSLGGMYVESMVACIALLIWNATGPSLLHSFAHQAVTLASIVTIGFNINPLMRYDGYYILSDLVEIPNLRERSATQLKSVCKRCLLGIRCERLPFSWLGRTLLLTYGAVSSLWKVSLVVAICAGIALKIHILGAVMAAVYGTMLVWGMLSKFVLYLWRSPETAPVRGRAITLGLIVLVGLPSAIAAIPFRRPIEARGVIAAIDEQPVCARTSGFLKRCEIAPGQTVKANDLLFVLENVHTRATAASAGAQLCLLELQAEGEFQGDRAAAEITRRRASHLRHSVEKSQRDVANLNVTAPVAGRVVDCEAIQRTGRFVKEGERIATITSGEWIIRSLVTAEDLADTKPKVGQQVRVRLLSSAADELSGTIIDIAVTGSEEIESPSLTQLGGGTIAVAPDTMTAGEPFFEILIELDRTDPATVRKGLTALVCFEATPQTLGTQLLRSALRFLDKLRT